MHHLLGVQPHQVTQLECLYAKEMVQKNFPGLPSDQLLDRLIELSLYTEENLR